MIDARASNKSGTMLLVWLPVNSCMALLFGAPDQPMRYRTVLRLYRTKDEAWADWHRING